MIALATVNELLVENLHRVYRRLVEKMLVLKDLLAADDHNYTYEPF